jgi:glycine/D-amino acid oxidase-like deaminating enzyme
MFGLRKVKRLAEDAKNTAQTSVFGHAGRGIAYKLGNAIGSDRELYSQIPNCKITRSDLERWQALEKQEKTQLEMRQAGYQALTNARAYRVQSDSLHLQMQQQNKAGQAYLESVRLEHQLAMAKVQTQLNGKRRAIDLLLQADADLEERMAWQTVDTTAQTTAQTTQAQASTQWGEI